MNKGIERVNNAVAPGNDAAEQRSGSSINCAAVGSLQPTDDANYFCFTWNSTFTHTWTWLQNLRTNKKGWVRDDILKPPFAGAPGGSSHSCGFPGDVTVRPQ